MPGSSSTISNLRGLSVTPGCCHRWGKPPKQRGHRTGGAWRRSTLFRAHEGRNLADDVFPLLGRELGVDRQRQDLCCGTLRFGEIVGVMLEVGEAALRVQWHRVVDFRAD